MERSINPELLGLALGQHESLPDSRELSRLLADAELALLLRSPQISDHLVATGWYLHGIASSKHALSAYGVRRQRAAFQVSGHIFDLKLQTPEISAIERFKYCFAAQVAYARSDLDPNALALYKREYPKGIDEYKLIPDFQLVSLSCGIAFLGFDIKYIYQLTSRIREEVDFLEAAWELDDIVLTTFGAAANLAFGVRDLTSFLVYGKSELLTRAKEKLRTAVTAQASLEDDLSRWVAAHLLNFSDNLKKSSIWNVLPPNVPPSVRKAFINGSPPILTLWPPQIDFLGIEGVNNPLYDNAKRLLLSTPTSSGKTLTAQLLITAHLSTKNSGVCYIAPTRSLCREVRNSLQSRLRFIDGQIVDGLPEGYMLDNIIDDLQPEVEVMTPERLSYLLRTNSSQVLDRFGMFIFDEVHLVNDKGRGWTLEEDLSYLHYATQHLHHKIVLISAVIGNRNHIIQWLSREDHQSPVEFHTDWRGPRRIHAIWTTEALWNESSTERNNQAKKYFYQKTTPLYGRLNLRISQTGSINTLRTTEPVGELVSKREKEDGNYIKDKVKSTPFYKMLVSVINYLSEFGPVLIIEATKPSTIRLAEAIAETKEPINLHQIVGLVDLVTARLGSEHPLTRCLEKGVAYHHGSLPSEIRIALEEAVSDRHLKYIVATTTLTEGINLPVTSVVIASQGTHGEEGYTEYITGSRLVNAIGRAGRATKETEGIVVLARQAPPSINDFNRLNPEESDLQVNSMLVTEKALVALATFEELCSISEDAVLEANGDAIADFLKYIWFITSELEKLNQLVNIESIEEILSHTLGWVQLDPSNRSRWIQAAKLSLNQYLMTEESVRHRWASSGTSIHSSRILEQIAQNVVFDLEGIEIPQGIIEAVELIIANNRLHQLLQLPEAPKRKVYTQRGGNRTEIQIPSDKILLDWLRGMSLIEISEVYLRRVLDMGFRFEELGDYIYSRFEVFLPWVFGTVIDWVNKLLLENGSENFLPTSVPANIRYGVGDPISLELMVRGIQSRHLAVKISESWHLLEGKKDVISWIRSLSLSQWEDLFDASPNEIRNLLEIARKERGGVAVNLFNTGQAELDIITDQDDYPKKNVTLRRIDDSEFSPIGIWDENNLVGTVHLLPFPDTSTSSPTCAWIKRVAGMRLTTFRAPHKPFLLLAILDLFAQARISLNQILV
jgi:superfamily II DNA/RNA helicase